jgi:RHS repeat-associated protein
LKKPTHVYTQTGSFTVILTATADGESDVETKTDYVTVSAAVGSELVTRTITCTYDSLYRLTGADYSSGEGFAYAYDAVGNMMALTATITNTVVTTKVYDAANRLITVTTGGVARTLEWSDAGELLHDGDDAYAWDAAGRLVWARVDGVLNRYAYLGDGGRISMTVDSETTTYTLDLASLLVQVLVAHEPAKPEPTSYLYGVARIGEYDGAWRYHLADHLGSVRSLVGTDGDVVGIQAYWPYGLLLSMAGLTSSVYGFAGEQTETTGLVYLRARVYSPLLRRFTSRDPWVGDYENPQTLNDFSYAGNDPVRYVDPTGLWRWALTGSTYHFLIENYYQGNIFNPNKQLEYWIRSAHRRVDMFNSLTGDVYEIEPTGKQAEGASQVIDYVSLLQTAAAAGQLKGVYDRLPFYRQEYNWNSTPFHIGSGVDWPGKYRRPFLHPLSGVDLVADYIGQGVILYWLEPNIASLYGLLPFTVPNKRLVKPRNWVPGQLAPQPVLVMSWQDACGYALISIGGVILALNIVENVTSLGVGVIDDAVVLPAGLYFVNLGQRLIAPVPAIGP